jgi:hypothetical protein
VQLAVQLAPKLAANSKKEKKHAKICKEWSVPLVVH